MLTHSTAWGGAWEGQPRAPPVPLAQPLREALQSGSREAPQN